MKLFRKFRQNMLKNKRTSAYLLYALGEIILVMVGILLALQVNNWNESRKQRTELNNILSAIASDMATDTLVANRIIEIYEDKQKNMARILNRELNMENYRECPQCAGMITTYSPFNLQTKGIELLKDFKGQTQTQNDSLVNNITTLYSILKPVIDKSNERLESVVINNMDDFREYPWFVNWTQGTFNEEMIRYFTESEDYRKRVAAHSVLASGNHLLVTKEYKRQVTELLKMISDRLSNDE